MTYYVDVMYTTTYTYSEFCGPLGMAATACPPRLA